eukprot:8413652-Lingulodinium_polyedra.AAC.1
MSEEWHRRLLVTQESFDLMVRYFIAAAERGISKKKDRQDHGRADGSPGPLGDEGIEEHHACARRGP